MNTWRLQHFYRNLAEMRKVSHLLFRAFPFRLLLFDCFIDVVVTGIQFLQSQLL